MLWRIFTTLPGDSPWHAAAHNGVRSLVFIAKEWSDPETFQVCAFLWHCCRHIWTVAASALHTKSDVQKKIDTQRNTTIS